MGIPIDLLIGKDENKYVLTCAAIRRAKQLTITGDEELEKHNKKIVSTAITQMITKEVEYRLEE